MLPSDNSADQRHWFLDDNPLLESIPQFADPADFLRHLSFSPLAGLDVAKLSFMDRYALLVGEKTPLRPTTQSLRAAMTWYGMLRVSLSARNPLRPEAKKRYWDVLNAAEQGEPPATGLPTQGIAAQIVKGPTGTAKTVTARRFCAMLGPQCINLGARPDAGWMAMRQLVYLYSDLSHDGSRGGFLFSLLVCMDRALDTSYASDLPRRYKTIEKLGVATIGRLIAHHTGILFIDEGQLRNLMYSDQAVLMQMFLLALINSGIPIVVIGNETAFDWIDYSQDQSRLNVVGTAYFHPVGAIDHPDAEDDWDALYQGISEFYVLDLPPSDPDACKLALRQFSGGIGRIGLTLWTSAQRDVLEHGGQQICREDLLAAYNRRDFDELRPLADGFAKRLPELLVQYPDVDGRYYARSWGKAFAQGKFAPVPAERVQPGSCHRPQKTRASSQRSEQSKLKAEKTRERNRQEQRSQLLDALGEDDIRKSGLKALLLSGLEAKRDRAAAEAAACAPQTAK